MTIVGTQGWTAFNRLDFVLNPSLPLLDPPTALHTFILAAGLFGVEYFARPQRIHNKSRSAAIKLPAEAV